MIESATDDRIACSWRVETRRNRALRRVRLAAFAVASYLGAVALGAWIAS